jgi:hypothetical protein
MLHLVKSLRGLALKARDGSIGSVKDFYFDDQFWTVRYLIADTAGWMSGRSVLISPYALESVDVAAKEIATTLTRKQIEESPPLESDKPVSRQFEQDYYGYYGWPSYWGGPYMWGTYPSISRNPEYWTAAAPDHKPWDPHLRSVEAVTGYHIQAPDGEIGHVDDFIIDDETWSIRYLVITTRNWLPGKRLLLSPHWIGKVSWEESKVFVYQNRDIIRQAPEYTEEALTRAYESRLHNHYDKPGYWLEETGVNKSG